jgi:hypothetical protein
MKKLISKSLILVGVLIYGNANAQQNEITISVILKITLQRIKK